MQSKIPKNEKHVEKQTKQTIINNCYFKVVNNNFTTNIAKIIQTICKRQKKQKYADVKKT